MTEQKKKIARVILIDKSPHVIHTNKQTKKFFFSLPQCADPRQKPVVPK